jgi:hypothetical protein
MISKLRFATPGQILAMSLIWLAACVGIDYTFNPQLWAKAKEVVPASVPLSIHLHHLRCNGCSEQIEQALRTLPWLKDAPMNVRTPGPEITAGDYQGWLDITVANPTEIDFVALDQALRNDGWVASQFLFGGLRHYRLIGKARHLCSPTSQTGCEPLPDLGKTHRADRLQWLDSVTTDGNTVVFNVRFQQPSDRIDVKELFTAIDEFGLLPSTLKVVTTPE